MKFPQRTHAPTWQDETNYSRYAQLLEAEKYPSIILLPIQNLLNGAKICYIIGTILEKNMDEIEAPHRSSKIKYIPCTSLKLI